MKFRKKPVVIEARQLGVDYDEDVAIMRWCNGSGIMDGDDGALFTIPTLEGAMVARTGDWVVRGVHGEFYPCKPDIFALTYEPVEPAQVTDAGATPPAEGATESAHISSSSSRPQDRTQ